MSMQAVKVGLLIGVPLAVFMVLLSNTRPTEAQYAERQAQEAADRPVKIAVGGALLLKRSMRNPASFHLDSGAVMPSGAVCYDYRAQNGFGGMNVGHAVLTKSGRFFSQHDAGFTKAWNQECTQSYSTDIAALFNQMSPD